MELKLNMLHQPTRYMTLNFWSFSKTKVRPTEIKMLNTNLYIYILQTHI